MSDLPASLWTCAYQCQLATQTPVWHKPLWLCASTLCTFSSETPMSLWGFDSPWILLSNLLVNGSWFGSRIQVLIGAQISDFSSEELSASSHRALSCTVDQLFDPLSRCFVTSERKLCVGCVLRLWSHFLQSLTYLGDPWSSNGDLWPSVGHTSLHSYVLRKRTWTLPQDSSEDQSQCSITSLLVKVVAYAMTCWIRLSQHWTDRDPMLMENYIKYSEQFYRGSRCFLWWDH